MPARFAGRPVVFLGANAPGRAFIRQARQQTAGVFQGTQARPAPAVLNKKDRLARRAPHAAGGAARVCPFARQL